MNDVQYIKLTADEYNALVEIAMRSPVSQMERRGVELMARNVMERYREEQNASTTGSEVDTEAQSGGTGAGDVVGDVG